MQQNKYKINRQRKLMQSYLSNNNINKQHSKMQPKLSGQVYISSTINSARLSSLNRNRYAQTGYNNFSVSMRNKPNGNAHIYSAYATSHGTNFQTPTINTSSNIGKQKIVCINDQLFSNRKQNHLQTQANRRFRALKKIQLQNERLTKRINSQKSLYSQDNLNKSNVTLRSSNSISRCSSRDSVRSGKSNRSNRSGANYNKNKKTDDKQKQKISIQQQNVQKLEKKQIDEFKNIFLGMKTAIKQKQQGSILPPAKTNPLSFLNQNTIYPKYNVQTENKQKAHSSFTLRKQVQTSPSLNSQNPDRKIDNNRKTFASGMGDMLHRIVQDIYQSQGQEAKGQHRGKTGTRNRSNVRKYN